MIWQASVADARASGPRTRAAAHGAAACRAAVCGRRRRRRRRVGGCAVSEPMPTRRLPVPRRARQPDLNLKARLHARRRASRPLRLASRARQAGLWSLASRTVQQTRERRAADCAADSGATCSRLYSRLCRRLYSRLCSRLGSNVQQTVQQTAHGERAASGADSPRALRATEPP